MNGAECSRRWELEVYEQGLLSAADSASIERHLAACEACARVLDEHGTLRELGRALPERAVSELHARRLRAALLGRAARAELVELGEARPSSPRTRAFAALLACALAAGSAGLALRGEHPRASARASAAPSALPLALADARVDASADARFQRMRAGLTERVKLTEGELSIRVKLLVLGARFIVETPDAELEVHGTVFDVKVHAGATESVRVREGLVELRRAGVAPTFVAAGSEWRAPPVLELGAEAAKSEVPASPAPRRAPNKPRTKPADAREHALYLAGMEDFRASNFTRAAERFHAFATSHPTAVEAEDAAFLEAVSLVRADRPDAAGVVAERFNERYPHSIHEKDAALVSAHAARLRGDCRKTQALLAAFSEDARARNELAACGGG